MNRITSMTCGRFTVRLTDSTPHQTEYLIDEQLVQIQDYEPEHPDVVILTVLEEMLAKENRDTGLKWASNR